MQKAHSNGERASEVADGWNVQVAALCVLRDSILRSVRADCRLAQKCEQQRQQRKGITDRIILVYAMPKAMSRQGF